MKRFIFPFIFLASLAAWGSELDELALKIAADAPGTKAEHAQAEAELLEARAENVLGGPEADFDYKFAPSGVENRWGLSIGQAFDWPGVYAARRTANGWRSEAFRALSRRNLLEKALDVKLALIRLGEARANRQLTQKTVDSFEKLYNTYTDALERGEAIILEVKKVELKLYEMRTRLARAESECEAARMALVTFAGEDATRSITLDSVPVAPLASYDIYSQDMLRANPELDYAAALSSAAKADMSVARRSALPSFRVAYVHDFEEGFHFNGFGVSISLPAWNNRAKTASAASKAFAAEQTLAEKRLLAGAEFYSDYDEASRLLASLEAGRKVMQGDEYIAYLDMALQAGRLPIYTYLTEYAEYLDAKMAYIALQSEYARAQARLSRYSIDR